MYIKGGSVVDGNFYIEGGLRVNSIIDAQGNTFISTASADKNRLVMFTLAEDNKTAGQLTNSTLLEESTTITEGGASTHYSYFTVSSPKDSSDFGGYSPILKLRLTTESYVDDGTAITYYDSSYNKVATKSESTYRTFTDTEETDSNIFPDAWAYAV